MASSFRENQVRESAAQYRIRCKILPIPDDRNGKGTSPSLPSSRTRAASAPASHSRGLRHTASPLASIAAERNPIGIVESDLKRMRTLKSRGSLPSPIAPTVHVGPNLSIVSAVLVAAARSCASRGRLPRMRSTSASGNKTSECNMRRPVSGQWRPGPETANSAITAFSPSRCSAPEKSRFAVATTAPAALPSNALRILDAASLSIGSRTSGVCAADRKTRVRECSASAASI